ncbi:glycosyltransferase family 2 protein [Flavobacteriaceae bacterium S356]|uniref:Glycosyltransferase family 2 protein n=1 Tax=Asprobacillus argus TaxID=3076534 RepID=A0ABU3LFU7_9FLAO|nr:glycosyltransferase family 2 protein [Flavobacteriaceae bacterium S356]
MKAIGLVLFNGDERVTWSHGPVYSIEYTTKALLEVRTSILNENIDYILFWDFKNKLPSNKELEDVIKEKGTFWHIGSILGLKDKPSLIEIVQPTNMNNVRVDASISHSSWKVTFKGCLLERNIFESVVLQNYSNSLDIIGLDFGYNAMILGAMPRFSKNLAMNVKHEINTKIRPKDELAFIKKNLDKKAFIWCYMIKVFSISPYTFVRLMSLKRNKKNSAIKRRYNDNNLTTISEVQVSVVIATLNRYKVLQEELRELRELVPSPKEIVIVDQTPVKERNSTFLEEFSDLSIQYITTEKIGQCSARNTGIKAAEGNYIWFLDDDMKEFPKDYLSRHLKTLQEYNADVSCGIPDEVGTDFMDRSTKHVFLSDGFPTNDVVVRKDLLENVDGFDEAMDQLQSEDQEIGLRLVKNGALSVKNNQLRLLHLRAPIGGLRTHKVRKSTFSASRKSVFKRRLLHYSEIYLSKKHFPRKNVFYLLLLNLRGTFIVRGNVFKKIIKIIIGIILLVPTIFVLSRKNYLANQMIKK